MIKKIVSFFAVIILLFMSVSISARSADGTGVGIQSTSNPDQSRILTLVPRQEAVKPTSISLSPNMETDRVVVKLVEGTRARIAGGQIYSLSGKNVDPVNSVLASKISSLKRLSRKSPEAVEREKFILEYRSGWQLADMNNYFYIEVSSTAEAQSLVNSLNRLNLVEIAYAEPRPTIATDIDPPTPDFTGTQDYLNAAPDGVDADYAQTLAGGDGSGVRIIDIEGNWKFDHEDLETAVNGLIGGELISESSWRNHGTAVVGVMVGNDNGYGITGIVPQAQINMVSVGEIGTTEAMLLAVDSLDAGDIMLIELHAPGPRYNFEVRSDQLGYVCMEYWQANFDALQLAWAKGIIVCEAAGNGAENFNDQLYESKFDTTYRNSHAIICGAGAPPSGLYGIDRSRLSFSNYGTRVDLQGYGRGVVTCGYGDLFNGSYDERQYYTSDFAGTSSASPIVTGAVAALQGIYKSRYGGALLTADMARDILVSTGSEQQGSVSQHIGPRPDLLAAEAVLPPPSDLTVVPLYFDTTIQAGFIDTVQLELYNNSASYAIDYAISTLDSMAKDGLGDWLVVTNPNGNIAPQGNVSIELLFDATVIDGSTSIYKGLVEILSGESGLPLDQSTVVPVFLDVPCHDTAYSAISSLDPGGPEFEWIDITTIGNEIASYSWYNEDAPEAAGDDGTAGPYFIGFEFPFYESSYNFAFVGANGAVSFTDTNLNINGYYAEVFIPGSPFETFVSPFWNDLNLDATSGGHGAVYFYRSPKNDSFIVEFFQAGNFNSADDTLTTFEVIFTRDGDIKFQYLSVGNSGLDETATVGISEIACAAQSFENKHAQGAGIVSDSMVVLFEYSFEIWLMSGDANNDGSINLADASFIINYIFQGGPPPAYPDEGDPNCDGSVNLGDAGYLVNYIFYDGPPPCLYML